MALWNVTTLCCIFFPFEHSHSDDEIQINLTATDAFGLERVLPIAVIVEPIQTIPQAFLPDVHMIENQEPRFIHVTTAEEAQGDFAFIDHDSYTNLYGDSVKFEAETSEPDLLEVVMLTQAQTAAGAPAVDCVFPFTFAGITYENCTTAGTGLHGPRGYQARFSWCSLDGSELTGDVIAALQANRIAKMQAFSQDFIETAATLVAQKLCSLHLTLLEVSVSVNSMLL